MRLEQIVEPGRPGAFFEGHGQSSTQSCKELQNGSGFGFQDGFHDYLALSIHHRYADGCLMHVQPNILFTAHKGAPFVGGVACAHNLLQKGRPFIMRFRKLMNFGANTRILPYWATMKNAVMTPWCSLLLTVLILGSSS